MGTTETELRQSADYQRTRMGETLDAIGDRLSPERVVERRKAAVGQRFRRVRVAIMGSPDYAEPGITDRMTDKMTDTAKDAVDRVQHAPEAAAARVRGNPLAAGLIAFGVGALVATAFPSTETEQRLAENAQPQLQAATDELRDAGRDLGTQAKERAQSAAHEVSDSMKDAASNVADEARSSAEEVRRSAT